MNSSSAFFHQQSRNCLKNFLLLLAFFLPVHLIAQQHPITVEPSTLLESGHAQFEFGTAHFRQQPFPLSGLTGNLTKIGNIRFCISLSEYVELQTDGTLLNVLDITRREPAFNSAITTSNNLTADIGDFSIWTKLGVLREYGSGIGLSVRFGVQMPNASNESGLGVDEMNFYSSLLLQKHFAGVWTANAGLGILSDPTKTGSQHDVCTYGLEYLLPVGESTFFMVQTAGRTGHTGTGINDLRNWKVGFEESFGDLSLRLFGVKNYAPSDKATGVELTFMYLFHIVEMK